MSSGHIIAIKTRPYLKDYYINYFGGSEPIKATVTNKLFPFLIHYLTPKPKNWKPPEPAADILLIELPYNDEHNVRYYNYIHPRHNRPIASYLYGLFYAQFIRYMNEKVMQERWQVKYAIYNFLDQHNIDCTNYETLQKIYYRYRYPESEKMGEVHRNYLKTFQEDSEKIRSQFSIQNNRQFEI